MRTFGLMYQINPAFHRFSNEAAIIGRLVVAFGELEYMTVDRAGKAIAPDSIEKYHSILKAIYRVRATSGRIDAADALMRPIYCAAGLEDEYGQSIAALWYCLRIRNQFAHCNWADDHKEGLFFTDLQGAANSAQDLVQYWYHVDVPLLESHEEYFVYTQSWLYHLDCELDTRKGLQPSPHFPKPTALNQPPLHNSPDQHVPPWLTSDLRARHLARAQAAQGGVPTPTPVQQAQDRAREAKRAKRQEDRERNLAKHSDSTSQQ